MNYVDSVRKWLVIKCQLELGEEVDAEEYKGLMAFFLENQKPMKFNPFEPDNILRQRESDFMDMCNAMEDNGAFNPTQLSEYHFYSKIAYYEKKYKKLKEKT